MTLSIKQSVGINGVNQRADVKLIQVLLNSYAAWQSPFTNLKVDGLIGAKTNNAIKRYQREAAGIMSPDGRVDPNGKTFRYLTMYINPGHEPIIQQQIHTGKIINGAPLIDKKTILEHAGLKGLSIIYSSDLKKDKQIISNYSAEIIKIALKEAGIKTAVITSTIRTPEEQASIMLENAKKNLKKQYQLYGTDGDSILKIYEKNKSKPDAEIKNKMIDKIKDLEKQGKRVSKHCVSKETYLQSNIIDIGLNSMKAANKNFDPKKFTLALQKLKDEGYLDTFIDETMKSNSTWHIEITANKKVLSSYEKNTILNTTSFAQ